MALCSLRVVVGIFTVLIAVFLHRLSNVYMRSGIFNPVYLFFFPNSNTLAGLELSTIPRDPWCTQLSQDFPDTVFLPEHLDFAQPNNAYWSYQAQALIPSCVARPRNASDVARVVQALKSAYDKFNEVAIEQEPSAARVSRVRFAVKSGGHSPEPGTSSIESGVLLDLGHLNEIEIASNRASTRIGVGAHWGEVYTRLDSMGLRVVGGRSRDVGVGGFILGGGISFYSPHDGMACDNVADYEIVLANGTITHASETQNADLWKALKGGAGNFGIVTQITTKTLPGTNVWGGYVYYPHGLEHKLLSAFHEFAKLEHSDADAAGPILVMGYAKKFGIGFYGLATHLLYTKPVAWAPVLQKFKSLWRLWSFAKVRTLHDAAEEVGSVAPFGQRQYQTTITVKNDKDTLNGLYDIFSKTIPAMKGITGVCRCLVLQPLPPAAIHQGTLNALGLADKNSSQAFIIVLIQQAWALESDDDFIYRTTRQLMDDMKALAIARGTLDEYIYLNYAASHQDVFAGYGKRDVEFLRGVSRKYDPDRFWQVAKQGGFKLDTTPEAMNQQYIPQYVSKA